MSRRSFARGPAALAASALLVTFATLAAGLLEKKEEGGQEGRPPAERKEKGEGKDGHKPPAPLDEAEIKANIDKMIDDSDLTPKPQTPIPDDPPPHEGALIGIPYVVEPTDQLIVEVLEALPGRPISGERLVRQDGTISLGFYGDVRVGGLTLPQIKIAIIKHLRGFPRRRDSRTDLGRGRRTGAGRDPVARTRRREEGRRGAAGRARCRAAPLDDGDTPRPTTPHAAHDIPRVRASCDPRAAGGRVGSRAGARGEEGCRPRTPAARNRLAGTG